MQTSSLPPSSPSTTYTLNQLSRISPPKSMLAMDGKNGAANAATAATTWDRYKLRGVCEKLLSLDDPGQMVTSSVGITSYISKPLCFEVLACIITQDHTPYDAELELSSPDYARPHIFATKLSSPATAETRLAYQACLFLFGSRDQSQPPSKVEDALRLRGIEFVGPIFRALRTTDSSASIFHLCFVIQNMIRVVPDVVTGHLAEIGARTKVIIEALIENAHCSGVSSVLIDLFTMRLASMENPMGCRVKDTLLKYKKRLLQFPWLSLSLKRVLESDATSEIESERASGLADFVVGTLSRYSSFNELGEVETTLLKPLANANLFEKLIDLAASSKESELRNIAISLLSAFAKLAMGKLVSDLVDDGRGGPGDPGDGEDDSEASRLSMLKQRQLASSSKPLNKIFLEFSKDIKATLLPLLTANLGRVLANVTTSQSSSSSSSSSAVTHTSYKTDEPFTLRRLSLVKLLKDAVMASPQHEQSKILADTIPWVVLCKWFTAYPNNSLFLCEFVDLFTLALMAEEGQMEAARKIVCECKFVSYLVTRLKTADTASDHAHVVKCLNIIRLRVDQLPKKHWCVLYLKSHTSWIEARDVLVKVTQRQLQPLVRSTSLPASASGDDDGPASAIMRDLFGNDPNNPLLQGGPPDLIVGEVERELSDVELGSAFAKTLGFFTAPSTTGTASKQGAGTMTTKGKDAAITTTTTSDEALFAEFDEDTNTKKGKRGSKGGKKR